MGSITNSVVAAWIGTVPSRVSKLEILLLEACRDYIREYEKHGKGVRSRPLSYQRGRVRALATALVWTSYSESRPHVSQIEATEKEFIRRARNDLA